MDSPVSFWDHLPPSARRQLIELGQPRRLLPGAVVLRRGQPADEVLLIEAGRLEVVDAGARPAVVLAVLEPGDVTGEMAFIDGEAASADVRASHSSQCRAWSHPDLAQALARDSDLAAAVWQAFARDGVARGRSATRTALHLGGATHDVHHPDVAAVVEAVRAALAVPPGQRPALGVALAQAGEKLARLDGLVSRQRVGAAARLALLDAGDGAPLWTALLSRPPGAPGRAAFDALLPEAPAPAHPLDAALLAAPTGRALSNRTRVIRDHFASAPARSWARLSLDAGAAAPLLTAALRPHGGQLFDQPTAPALRTWLHPTAPTPSGWDGLLVGGALDALPDRALVALLLRVGAAGPAGAPVLCVGLAPTNDRLGWEALLGWPTHRRTTAALAHLAAAGGLSGVRVAVSSDGVAMVVGEIPPRAAP